MVAALMNVPGWICLAICLGRQPAGLVPRITALLEEILALVLGLWPLPKLGLILLLLVVLRRWGRAAPVVLA